MYPGNNVMMYAKNIAYKSREKKSEMQLGECKASPVICKAFII